MFSAIDAAYQPHSFVHPPPADHLALLAMPLLMTAVLLLGLLAREERGVGRIGLESVLILAIYALAVPLIVWRV